MHGVVVVSLCHEVSESGVVLTDLRDILIVIHGLEHVVHVVIGT